ncbi:hypothetical protein CAMGR0001_2796 [Campylobacter gracilis RM3268]|uniref:Uncharacterized protein n=1 Tax=Campylobacter gracilis RM3268 TaxID=553220 RepID=C8PL06_9BACT|nr:hypothetical protein CAMGR0001_2796 [Campylobacter gracilis RM3268]
MIKFYCAPHEISIVRVFYSKTACAVYKRAPINSAKALNLSVQDQGRNDEIFRPLGRG